MTSQLDNKHLDEFCPQLFRALDKLGLLPMKLGAKPTEFEKYSRLLIGSIQRYHDAEAGFREWESRVLREAAYRKEEYYHELTSLRWWIIEHKDVFAKKQNLQHLRSSLYARAFYYLYPRRVLANAYCARHHGNLQAIDPSFLDSALPESVKAEVQKVREVYNDEWPTVVVDTRESLIANTAYYRVILRSERATPRQTMMVSVEEPESQIAEEEQI